MKVQVYYLLVVNAAIVFLASLGVYAWLRGRRGEWRGLAVVASSGALWALSVAVMALTPPEQARTALNAKYTMLGVTNVAMFLFIARQTGAWRTTRPLPMLALLALPVCGHAAAWGDTFGSFRHAEFARAYDLTYLLRLDYGPLYLLTTAYHFALVLIGLGMAAVYIRRGGALARRQGVALFLAMAVPSAVNALVISDTVPRVFDLMPVGHAVSAAALFWGVFRHQMLDLAPVARHALVDALQDGIVIIDADRRILDVNASAASLARTPADDLLGRSLGDVMACPVGDALRAASVAPAPRGVPGESPVVTFGDRFYDVRALAVGGTGARVLVMHDVTERHRWLGEQTRLVAELRDALAHVKTLSGLLPICAGCKCIRDSEGAWLPLEQYIGTRTDAEFSHGMCPTCVPKWFPELPAEKP